MKLRVIQAGIVSPIYSQAIYHGLAEQMQADDTPILVILQPDNPYICIGLHQHLDDEIDINFCINNQIPTLRRNVGGGTVLLDSNQLFFQFIFPRAKAPNQPKELYPYLLKPVLHTYHHFGIPASLKSLNDIQASNKKIGGTGAGTINNSTVLVGSFLFDFNYRLMSSCVKAPSENFRACLEGILEKNITTIKAQVTKIPTTEELIDIFLEKIKVLLGFEVEQINLSSKETEAISNAEIDLTDDEWLNIDGKKLVSNGLKISAGIYLLEKTLPFCDNSITIRIQFEKKCIHTIWLESENPQIQASLILVATEINNIKPSVDYIVLRELILEVATNLSSIQNCNAVELAREIYKLANFSEY